MDEERDTRGTPHSNTRRLNGSNENFYQLGDAIEGEDALDRSGWSVAMNGDGKRVIVGAYLNDGNGEQSGHARVFEEISGIWTKVGKDIDGEVAGDNAGQSVSMSSDGYRVVVGAHYNDEGGNDSGHVRIFQDVGGSWTQIGDDINGENDGDLFGWSVAMSGDGMRVIVGAPNHDGSGEDAGQARIFQNNDGIWAQVGDNIDGESTGDRAGWSVSISYDGRRVIVGADKNDANGISSGHVRIFQESNGTWAQIGDDIYGEDTNDNSGTSVAMSSDGKRVIVGADGNDGKDGFQNRAGHARVFQEANGSWSQVGDDLDGESRCDSSGYSVGISGNGKRVIVGAPWNTNENGNSWSGHARIFEEIEGSWVQIGDDIDGQAYDDRAGQSVAISMDGNRIIVGAYRHEGINGSRSGHARIYFSSVPPTEAPAAVTQNPSFAPHSSSITPTKAPLPADTQTPTAMPLSQPFSSSRAPYSTQDPILTPSSQPSTLLNPLSSSWLYGERVWIIIGALLVFVVAVAFMLTRKRRKKSNIFPAFDSLFVDGDAPSEDDQVSEDDFNDDLIESSEVQTYKYDAFLTHNWGNDKKGRNNHERVVAFKNELVANHGIDKLWLDEERMTGNISERMREGIDDSKLVIVFITQTYIDKVAGRGRNADRDNCLLEFNYASRKKGARNLIAVVMEDGCNWEDSPVDFILGGDLYYSFKEDSDLGDCAKVISEEIRKRTSEV